MVIDRFDMEEQIMQCWKVVDDINTITKATDYMEIKPKDLDRLQNMLIGLKTLYDFRFQILFDTFEKEISNENNK